MTMEEPPIQQMEIAPDEQSEAAPAPAPPIDGGRDAWLVLATCTLMEALVWGGLLKAACLLACTRCTTDSLGILP